MKPSVVYVYPSLFFSVSFKCCLDVSYHSHNQNFSIQAASLCLKLENDMLERTLIDIDPQRNSERVAEFYFLRNKIA